MDQFVLDLGDDPAEAGGRGRAVRAGGRRRRRPRRTGPTPPARSPTRSSRASAPACRGSTSGRATWRERGAGLGQARRRRGRRGRRDGRGRSGGTGRRALRRRALVPYGRRPLGRRAVRRGARHGRAGDARPTVSPSTSRSTELARGPGTQPPVTVVLCHGLALTMDSWHHQRRDLADLGRFGPLGPARPRPVRSRQPGRRGHHRPARPRPATRCCAQTAPTGPVVLVGHSMGGMTVMALADQRPRAVRRPGRRRRPRRDVPRPPRRGHVRRPRRRRARRCAGRHPEALAALNRRPAARRAQPPPRARHRVRAHQALLLRHRRPAVARAVRAADARPDPARRPRRALPGLRRPRQARRARACSTASRR